MMQKNGIIFNIKKYAIHDGPGIRSTVFLQGCPLSCWWCHNPEGRAFGKTNVMSRQVSVSEVIAEVEKDVIFYDESGGGVTFSGGEPLSQAHFLYEMLTQCCKKEIHTTIDTSGYAPLESISKIAEITGLFLYDLKIMDSKDHIKYTGVSNELILENLKIIHNMGKNIIIRFPVIPEITDTYENISQILEFISSLKNIKEVSLLPFHNIAQGKYWKLKKEDKMKKTPPPDISRLIKIKQRFELQGFSVTIGG
ncbi:Radical SAM domain-containing protein [Desulfonema limicola]|uniref:Radical SAM domain-containing protein n=2 Tax=Desulfonema limicola TaxID=45656 RepID=A0A975GH62_9BACT|nr:Radical SAM domain-containing protein [Desulfonema limicola]